MLQPATPAQRAYLRTLLSEAKAVKVDATWLLEAVVRRLTPSSDPDATVYCKLDASQDIKSLQQAIHGAKNIIAAKQNATSDVAALATDAVLEGDTSVLQGRRVYGDRASLAQMTRILGPKRVKGLVPALVLTAPSGFSEKSTSYWVRVWATREAERNYYGFEWRKVYRLRRDGKVATSELPPNAPLLIFDPKGRF